MSLRTGVVEAIVDALWEHGYSVSDVEAGAVFDAVLLALDANANEWVGRALDRQGHAHAIDLIAALRDTEVGPQ